VAFAPVDAIFAEHAGKSPARVPRNIITRVADANRVFTRPSPRLTSATSSLKQYLPRRLYWSA
jgi:hypothetical protein